MLNGYRGIVTGIGRDRCVEVERRRQSADGPTLVREVLTLGYIARGGLSHGTALTAAAAQDRSALVRHGPGCPHPLLRHDQ
ncbi:hypothetical protein PS9374_02696 [Planomonospora sphaerica]|uniref:Uncharacterized protein n=1 Tax=Planomonospora sphaerica TaxID=161355 RepID=A0A161MB14_9ACTN|nr:hypothetical protein PS9374_02696 [Planomonospora sphaerica]